MSSEREIEVNDYVSRFLLRYFRSATDLRVARPAIDVAKDRELLRHHWAISKPIESLVTYASANPHELQAILEFRRTEDNAQIRGRLDARETMIRRMVTGHPTLTVSYEPIRTFNSGPNHVLIWVLEQAWRLNLRFKNMLPEIASYLEKVESIVSKLERVRRFKAIQQATKQAPLSQLPGLSAFKEASRSRRQIYVHAASAYQMLREIEAGNPNAIADLLNETLIGPLHTWERFELAVSLGLAQALSKKTSQPILLGVLANGNKKPIIRIGNYAIFWQNRTDAYSSPKPEPSEVKVNSILSEYGLSTSADRPDVIVCDETTGEVLAIFEAKYFSSEENDGRNAFRSAVEQIVRYARGYRPFDEIDGLIDRSGIALIDATHLRTSSPKSFGVPWLIDFEQITQQQLEPWAEQIVSSCAPVCGAA